MASLLARLCDVRFMRYLAASVGALAIDLGSFMALLTFGVGAAPASAVGYSLGIVVHWLLSSRTVFIGDIAERGIARTRQKALFVLSALAGLAITTLVVGLSASLGLDPRLSKLLAVGLAFMATWLLRRHVVFGYNHASANT